MTVAESVPKSSHPGTCRGYDLGLLGHATDLARGGGRDVRAVAVGAPALRVQGTTMIPTCSLSHSSASWKATNSRTAARTPSGTAAVNTPRSAAQHTSTLRTRIEVAPATT
ncbi:hypothetical protein UO65_1342 [Actinokineospora spheciospongiae]|uniref:Uncharacterized protein n=1 Tax=Actinokineospora spheciospongiae TaxID=909613 RepID=W7JBA3_9PSEU|nr:hypothetical protein UO65_1342 [Actinokineospora spheciospongiae]